MESPKFGDGEEIIVNVTECKEKPPKKWELCNSLIDCTSTVTSNCFKCLPNL